MIGGYLIVYSKGEILIARNPIILGRQSIILNARKPIINRIPIILKPKNFRKINFNAKKYEGLTEHQKLELMSISHLGQAAVDRKLERFKDTRSYKFTFDELDCLNNFVSYYENLVCKSTGAISYSALSNAHYKKRSRNWKSLWKAYLLCKNNGWDYKIYLEAQFESVANWTTKVRYPLPNTLYSERAIAAYKAYLYRNEESYKSEGYDIRAISKNVGTYEEECEKKIKESVELIKKDIDYYMKNMSDLFSGLSESEAKIAYKSKVILDRWQDLSDEYLSSLSDFLIYVGDKSEYLVGIQLRLTNIEALQNTMAKVRLIMSIVRKVEKSVGIPTKTDFSLVETIESSTQELW